MMKNAMNSTICPTRQPARSAQRWQPVAMLCLLLVAGSLLVVSGGCQRSLFRSSDPRTQFDATERMRQQRVPLTQPDVFGNPEPALRARLGRRN